MAGDDEAAAPRPVTAPPWSLPPDARRSSRCWSRACAPWSRTVAGVPWPRWASPGPARPTRCPSRWPTGWPATRVTAGALELTGGGTRLVCRSACHVAAVGAAPEVRVDGAAAAAGQLLPLEPGQVLEVGRLRGGCRSYLSVAGGFLGPTWFASSASDELTGLGAGPLAPGAPLHAGPWAPPLGDHLTPAPPPSSSRARPWRCGCCRAPTPSSSSPTRWPGSPARSSRSGPPPTGSGSGCVAAAGEVAGRAPHAGAELDSQGVVTGAVQLPPAGDPVVLLPDHATLGGYPVVAVVVAADHGLLGQCAPGTLVRLVPVDGAEADEARRGRAGSSNAPWSATTRSPSTDGGPGQTSSLTAVPTPMTTTTTRRAGAGRARARRAPA